MWPEMVDIRLGMGETAGEYAVFRLRWRLVIAVSIVMPPATEALDGTMDQMPVRAVMVAAFSAAVLPDW